MLALYIASKGGAVCEAVQDCLHDDKWADQPLLEGSIAVAWRVIRDRARNIFTPPWDLFLRYPVPASSPAQTQKVGTKGVNILITGPPQPTPVLR